MGVPTSLVQGIGVGIVWLTLTGGGNKYSKDTISIVCTGHLELSCSNYRTAFFGKAALQALSPVLSFRYSDGVCDVNDPLTKNTRCFITNFDRKLIVPA